MCETRQFFENFPDGHKFPDIMDGDRGLVKIIKLFTNVNA
jgi:hypothetical protein